jgi:hypothetical protein
MRPKLRLNPGLGYRPLGWPADTTVAICSTATEENMKARLMACAAGLACLVPVVAGAQDYTTYMLAVSQEQIAVNVRAAGFAPLSRPALRGAVYYLRAMSRGNVEMRVAVDARTGRVLSATKVSETQRAAAQSPVPEAPPRYEPRIRGSGYSETAPLPPSDVPVANEPAPALPPAAPPAKKLAAQPKTPLARGPGANAPADPAANQPAATAATTPAADTAAASAAAAPSAETTETPAASAAAAPAAGTPTADVTATGAVSAPAKPPAAAAAALRPAISATPAQAKPPAVTMVPIAPLE